MSLSPRFRRTLASSIEKQLQSPYRGDTAYNSVVRETYFRYSTSAKLAGIAAVTSRRGEYNDKLGQQNLSYLSEAYISEPLPGLQEKFLLERL